MIDHPDSAPVTAPSPKRSKKKAKIDGAAPTEASGVAEQGAATEPDSPTQACVHTPFASSPKLNPFDLDQLRLSQDFGGLSVKKAILTVPVKKPAKEWWIQTNPDPDYRLNTVVLELREDNETYLVARPLWADLSTESTVSPRVLVTTVNSVGVCFLWPIRLPGPDGRIDDWNRSALEGAALAAKGKWVRIQSNRSLGAYEVSITEYSKPPMWPEASMKTLIERAFKDKFIDTLDHPVLKRLRGEL